MKRRPASLLLAGIAALPVMAAPAPEAACSSAPYHQLDFWVGDWDAFDVGADTAPAARVRVTRVLGGCAIHELYEAAGSGGLRGESLSIFDSTRGVWHQTWVTNRGRLLQIEGGLKGGRIVMQGDSLDPEGKRTSLRGVWWKDKDTVREQAETSSDGGHTWQAAFDLVFRAHHD